MTVQTDPLQQLRDVHAPLDPGWWPPAPGWWLLAAVALGAALWFGWRLLEAWRQRRPVHAAIRLHERLYARLQAGEIDTLGYANGANELIKRCLVRGLDARQLAPASGSAWLEGLDRLVGDGRFTRGPGRLLGDARFAPRADGDAAALHDAVNALFERLARDPGRAAP